MFYVSKGTLIKIFIVFIIAFFSIGIIFFRKKDTNKSFDFISQNTENGSKNNGNVQNKENGDAKITGAAKKITEKDKVKMKAESFITGYYSYTWGKFSNIETLYSVMTREMRNKETAKVKKMKENIKGKKRKFFSVRAEVVNSEFKTFEKDKAVLNVKIKLKEINGAGVTDTEVPSIRPNTSAFVDGKGRVYDGNVEDLVIKTYEKNVDIFLLKFSKEDWLVNRIE